MATVQQWGRKESIIWPPRGYVYTLRSFSVRVHINRILYLHSLRIWSFAAATLLSPILLRTETAA